MLLSEVIMARNDTDYDIRGDMMNDDVPCTQYMTLNTPNSGTDVSPYCNGTTYPANPPCTNAGSGNSHKAARSKHSGGVNVLLGDGSVRFIRNSIDLATWRALGTMNDRLTAYVELHRKLERTLPALPKAATPEQIDRNQRSLETLMRQARAGAKPGDLFTPEARPVILRLLATVFGGPEGAQLKSSILDENPVGIKIAVNGRYPDNVPVSTVPPEVLQTLPQLAEDMEYRFIGDRLILMDVHAHLVADFIEDALPK